MSQLKREIQNILTPDESIALLHKEKIFQLIPLVPLNIYKGMFVGIGKEEINLLLSFLKEPTTVIYQGIIYVAVKGLNFRGRLKEILTIYHNHLRKIIGNKKALLDLYEKIPAEDIANLTQNHVIFVMKQLAKSDEKALAAIRYLPPYEIHFENRTFYMPGCTLAIHIDRNLTLGNPEVIPDENLKYEHPFVFRGLHIFGQKICMGSFYNSSEKIQFQKLRFANSVNALLRQSVQILITGYNRGVNPANEHLTAKKYKKYLTKPRDWDRTQALNKSIR